MGRCTRTSAAITSIAVPPTSRRNVWSNVWPTLATSWRSSRSPPEPCLRHHQQEEFAATSEPLSFFLGPGNFTLSPSQIPDLILSHHPARAIARRLPPSAEISGSSRCNPVGPSSTAMTCPLRSTGITPLHHYYGAVRPSPAHRYFRPRGWSRLRLFPWHRRPGSHVPYDSLIELRAAYTPDAARSVSGHPPS